MSISQSLAKIAIVGLDNQSDALGVLDDETRALLDRGARDNAARRFLDALSLTLLAESIARVPVSDRFDELPPLPEETRRSTPEALRPKVCALLRDGPPALISATLFLLLDSDCALPEEQLLTLLALGRRDRALRYIIAGALSARGRWLVALNEDWANYRSDIERSLDEQPVLARTRWLNALRQQPREQRWTDLNAAWKDASAVVRARLARDLADFTEAEPLLAEAAEAGRASQPRHEAQRQLAGRALGDIRVRAAALLPDYLKVPSWKRRKLGVETPEDEDPNLPVLTELGADGQDEAELGLAKTVIRLGQLLTLAGPGALIEYLGRDHEHCFKAIANSHFGRELEYFLLEAALVHDDLDAVRAWARAYPKPKLVDGVRLALLIERARPERIASFLSVVASEHGGKLPTHPKFWRALFLEQQPLDAELTATLMPLLLTPSRDDGLNQEQQEALQAAALFEPVAALNVLRQWLASATGETNALTDALGKLLELKYSLEE